MITLSVIISALSGWAVFSKHVCDDFIEKHCLIFASILAFLVVLSGAEGEHNIRAFSGALTLLVLAGLWYTLKNFWNLYRLVYGRADAK